MDEYEVDNDQQSSHKNKPSGICQDTIYKYKCSWDGIDHRRAEECWKYSEKLDKMSKILLVC